MSLWTSIADQWEQQSGDHIFRTLGIEPNCVPRLLAIKAGQPAPAPCGQCPQERFFAAEEFDVGYGGAAGPGKTWALAMYGVKICVQYPGIRVGAFRRTHREIRESFGRELRKIGYAQALGGSWNSSMSVLRFTNGSELHLLFLETVDDAAKYQGEEFQLCIFDERTHMPPDAVNEVISRIRTSDPNIPVIGVRSGTNPGNIGHADFKAKFVTATNYGEHVVPILDMAPGRFRKFIPGKIEDNPRLNEEYFADLNGLDPITRKMRQDGDWDVFDGAVFTEWDRDKHVVKPFTLPLSWRRVAGVDYGFKHPFVCMTAAEDEDGRVWVYRERWGVGVIETDQARQILEDEGSLGRDYPIEQVTHFGDPSMWAKRGESAAPATAYVEAGLPLHRAQNSRVQGWHRMHSYLADGPACLLHREQGLQRCPMLHVFTSCPKLIATLPSAAYAKTGDPEDVAKFEGERGKDNGDDWLDATRYLLMGIGAIPQPLDAKAHRRTTDPLADVGDGRGYLNSQAGLLEVGF